MNLSGHDRRKGVINSPFTLARLLTYLLLWNENQARKIIMRKEILTTPLRLSQVRNYN